MFPYATLSKSESITERQLGLRKTESVALVTRILIGLECDYIYRDMAIIRNPLQCLSCRAKTITRTAPGLASVQEYKFPCPGCGIEIRFSLFKSKRAKVGYAFRRPINAKWVKAELGAIQTLTFDSFRVSPKDSLNVFSPFLEESLKLSRRAYEAYAREEGMRRHWIEKVWPWIQRLMTHFETRNKGLFDKDAKLEKGSPSALNWASRLCQLYKLIENAFNHFTVTRQADQERVKQRIALAQVIPGNLFDQLVGSYSSTSRMSKLWTELRAVRSEFLANYLFLSPILRTMYWSEPPKNLAEYQVSEKQFDELKHLYVNCFETVCRLTVIVIGIEALIHHKKLSLPTKKGEMSLWDYEAMQNGNKPSQLSKYPIRDMFVPFMDHSLRNGIGHHSAVYDAKTDDVVYYKQQGETLEEVRLPYTQFIDKVLKIYSAVELASKYFHVLHIKACESE